jgi:superfamily II DNA or RNA helicase
MIQQYIEKARETKIENLNSLYSKIKEEIVKDSDSLLFVSDYSMVGEIKNYFRKKGIPVFYHPHMEFFALDLSYFKE